MNCTECRSIAQCLETQLGYEPIAHPRGRDKTCTHGSSGVSVGTVPILEYSQQVVMCLPSKEFRCQGMPALPGALGIGACLKADNCSADHLLAMFKIGCSLSQTFLGKFLCKMLCRGIILSGSIHSTATGGRQDIGPHRNPSPRRLRDADLRLFWS